MIRFLVMLALLLMPSVAGAIVIRHDVADAKYRIQPAALPALADMPQEGHGTLIAPRWVVTAAHTIPSSAPLKSVAIGGIPRAVARVVTHPGYRTPPGRLIGQAMATGDAILILVLLASSDDIALIELAQPVTDVTPVALYDGADEPGQTVMIVGKGATGRGDTGHDPGGPNRTELRRAFNTVTSAHERWFCTMFDAPGRALPLEGIGGNGDSGSPVLIESGGQWQLAGMASWKLVQGDVRTARPGRYGQISCNVRLRHYRAWIDSIIAGPPPEQQPTRPR